MALPIYRKIKLFASQVVTDYIGLDNPGNNDFNIITLGNNPPAEVWGNDTDWTDPTLLNPNTCIEYNSDLSCATSGENHYKYMFDENFDTAFRFSTGFAMQGPAHGQLIYDFGRKIKPRQFKIFFRADNVVCDFELYFVNKNPSIAQEDLVTGDSVTEPPIVNTISRQVTGINVDNIGVDDDNDGIFRDVDVEGNDLDYTTVTITSNNGVETTGLRQCIIKKEFFEGKHHDDYQYMVIRFTQPGCY